MSRSDHLPQDEIEGVCFHQTHEIAISSVLSEVAAEEVLVHELLHACCRFAGMDKNDTMKLTEEEFVSRLSPVLHMVLSENTIIFPRNS